MADFPLVHGFLTAIYSLDTLNSYLLPQFLEYAHTHPMFNHRLTHRLGESFLVTGPEHAFLLPEMLAYGERELCAVRGGWGSLGCG